MVLGLDEIYMSLLRVVIQAQILAEAGDKPLGKGKVAGAVQWAMSTLGEDQLPFKATAAMFGCIPDCRESSLGLDIKFWCVNEGALPPVTPINFYLGGRARKKWATFFTAIHFSTFLNLISGLNMILGGPLSPNMSQGGEGVAETTIVSKGLSTAEISCRERSDIYFSC